MSIRIGPIRSHRSGFFNLITSKSAVLVQTEIVELKKGKEVQSVDFHVQMDCEIGVPEFFLGEPNDHNAPHDVVYVRESLEFMLQQLRYFASSDDETEYDLDICDLDLVFWELEPEDDCYQTTTAERIATTLDEVEYQLELLSDLEEQTTLQVYEKHPHNWKEDGF